MGMLGRHLGGRRWLACGEAGSPGGLQRVGHVGVLYNSAEGVRAIHSQDDDLERFF
jgi:hypothetical protein